MGLTELLAIIRSYGLIWSQLKANIARIECQDTLSRDEVDLDIQRILAHWFPAG